MVVPKLSVAALTSGRIKFKGKVTPHKKSTIPTKIFIIEPDSQFYCPLFRRIYFFRKKYAKICMFLRKCFTFVRKMQVQDVRTNNVGLPTN